MEIQAVIFALMAIISVGGAPGVQAADPSDGKPAAQTANAPAATDSKRYVEKAALADMFEVQSSQVALEKSKDPAVRRFAQHMVDAHTKSTNKLKDTLKAKNIAVTPPAELDQQHREKLAQLRSASGERFDQLYREMQVKGHQDALALHREYGDRGDTEDLKQFAKETVPVVQQHLNEIQALNKTGAR